MATPDFDKLYERVPVQQKDMLREFRDRDSWQELNFQGVVWRYIACGRGDRTLFFMPGAFVRADLWFYTIGALEEDYRILALDCPHEPFTPVDVNAAVLQIMQRQKVPSAIFIGISFGAGLAQCFLQRHAPMVEHLVLSHCAPATRAGRKLRRGAAIVKILELLPNRVFQMLISAVSRLRRRKYPPGSEWSDFARAYFCEITPQINKQVFLRFVHAGREMIHMLTSESQAIESWPGETLILSSLDDHGSYPGLSELKRQYPRARTHVFEQGGHHTILLFPELYTAAIASFLQEVP